MVAADPEGDRRRGILDEDPSDVCLLWEQVLDESAGPRIESQDAIAGGAFTTSRTVVASLKQGITTARTPVDASDSIGGV